MASSIKANALEKVKLEHMRSFRRYTQMTYFALKKTNVAKKRLICRYGKKQRIENIVNLNKLKRKNCSEVSFLLENHLVCSILANWN